MTIDDDAPPSLPINRTEGGGAPKKGGRRPGAGRKFDEEAWNQGRAALYIKDQLTIGCAVKALKRIIRGRNKDAARQFEGLIPASDIGKAVKRLEAVSDADNDVMLAAVREVAGMCSERLVSKAAHRAVAGVASIPRGEHADDPARMRRLNTVRKRTEQSARKPPPREQRAEWERRNYEEMVALIKEDEPDAPVGIAPGPFLGDFLPPPNVYWPLRPLRLLCVDPDCASARYEHMHCVRCGCLLRMDHVPNMGGSRGPEALELCTECYRLLHGETED